MQVKNNTTILSGRDIETGNYYQREAKKDLEGLKHFTILIKSHCEAEDYGDETLAESKVEAAKKFLKNMPWEAQAEWDVESLMEFIEEEIKN